MEGRKIPADHEESILLIRGEPGQDPGCNLHYDRKYIIGNTTGYIVAPKITRQASELQWQKVNEAASLVVKRLFGREALDKETKSFDESGKGNEDYSR